MSKVSPPPTSSAGKKRKRESCGRPRKEQQAYVYESYMILLNSIKDQELLSDNMFAENGETMNDMYNQENRAQIETVYNDLTIHSVTHEKQNGGGRNYHFGTEENGTIRDLLLEDLYEDFISSKYDKFFEKEDKQLDQHFGSIPPAIIRRYKLPGTEKRRRLNDELSDSQYYSHPKLDRHFGDIMSFSFQQSKEPKPSEEQFLREYLFEQQELTHDLNATAEMIQKQKEEQIAASRKAHVKTMPKLNKDQFQKITRQKKLCLNLALESQRVILDRFPKHLQHKQHSDKIDLNLLLCTEIDAFWKKYERVQNERVKRALREEAERKEKERHDKKLNFLLTQTELYSHFMAKKNKADSVDKDHLIMQGLQEDEYATARERALKASIAEKERLDHFSQDSTGEHFVPSTEIVTEPRGFHGKLKKYQLQGLQWLVDLYNQGINGMLCDEMGLGKTVQTIAFLTHIHTVHKPRYPFLIITPTTTLHNWLSEFKKFSPQLKILPYWGNAQQRKILRAGIKNNEYDVLLSSYGMIIEDFKTLSKLKFHFLVLDEAHAIKSSESLRWRKLLELDVRGRMLLTGTPIQNHLGELWALLHFIMPKLFDNRTEFEEWFSPEGTKGKKKNLNKVELDEMQLQRLHMILRPFMLRRLKSDVESELAPKEEYVLHCELNRQQREAYIEIRNTVVNHRKASLLKKNNRALLNTVMQLRKICNHPFLFLDENKEIPKQFVELAYGNQIRGLEFTSPYVFKTPLPFRESDTLVIPSIENPIKYHLPILLYSKLIEKSSPISTVRFSREAMHELPYTLPLSTVQFIQREFNVEILNTSMKEELMERVSRRLTPRVNDLVSEKAVAPPIEQVCSKIRHASQRKDLLKPVFIENRNVLRAPEIWHFVSQCSKMRLLDTILNKLRLDNEPEKGMPNKVLIFCQMTRMLDLLEKYCTMRRYGFMRMDGSTPVQVREALVQQFQSHDDKTFIFLLSTRAGGIGINLTKANHVIFYDCDWNPTLDSQAMDRVHRIGQKRKVTVLRLVSKNTVEERILQIAGLKMDIQSMVYKGSKLDKEVDVRQLLLLDDDVDMNQL
jgi:DNA helicase INO80